MQELNHFLALQTPVEEVALRLLLAALCGAVIGWDREAANKPAGVRTFMLITLGAAGFMLTSIEATKLYSTVASPIDPTRTLQGIAGGLGFLGAGSIIRSAGSVQGITTAATTWVAGAIGAIFGAGLYGLALMLTAFSFLTLAVVGRLKHRYTGIGYEAE